MDGEQVVLVTNYVDGTNLEQLLFSKKTARDVCLYIRMGMYAITIVYYTDQVLQIGVKITEAVHYMHTHDTKIIHQDIKPHVLLSTACACIII